MTCSELSTLNSGMWCSLCIQGQLFTGGYLLPQTVLPSVQCCAPNFPVVPLCESVNFDFSVLKCWVLIAVWNMKRCMCPRLAQKKFVVRLEHKWLFERFDDSGFWWFWLCPTSGCWIAANCKLCTHTMPMVIVDLPVPSPSSQPTAGYPCFYDTLGSTNGHAIS